MTLCKWTGIKVHLEFNICAKCKLQLWLSSLCKCYHELLSMLHFYTISARKNNPTPAPLLVHFIICQKRRMLSFRFSLGILLNLFSVFFHRFYFCRKCSNNQLKLDLKKLDHILADLNWCFVKDSPLGPSPATSSGEGFVGRWAGWRRLWSIYKPRPEQNIQVPSHLLSPQTKAKDGRSAVLIVLLKNHEADKIYSGQKEKTFLCLSLHRSQLLFPTFLSH